MTTTAITGIGVAAPNGLGTENFWTATLNGRSGIGPIQRFDASSYPSDLGGEITDFDPADHLPNRLIPQTDRMTQLALAASDWALADARLPPGTYEPTQTGVSTAAAYGGFEYGQRELHNLWSSGPEHVSVYMSFAWFYAVNTGQISIRHTLKGPAGVLIAGESGGLDAIAQARRNIGKGTRLVLTGGVDSSFCPYGWVARMTGQTPTTDDNPAHIPAEGGTILVLEDPATARARGAHIYGEITGYGTTFDPAPHRRGTPGLARAIHTALADAHLTPDDIGVIFPDGATHDSTEAQTIATIFGPHKTPTTIPKIMTGHMNSGAAPTDLATALLAIRDQVIPPTPAPHTTPNLVTGRPRPWKPAPALILARGKSGHNAAMIVQPASSTHG